MARPYSIDLRARVILAVERDGLSRNAAARRFGVAISTAVNWLARHRETGSAAPGQMGGYRPRKLIGAHRDWLLERTKTDFTLRGLVAELAKRGMKVDYRTLWSFAHDEGLSFKKSVPPVEQLRPQIARRRAQWKKYQGRPDPARLVFIDETWAKTNMAPLRGWVPRGQRFPAKVPTAIGAR
jgi:transposase